MLTYNCTAETTPAFAAVTADSYLSDEKLLMFPCWLCQLLYAPWSHLAARLLVNNHNLKWLRGIFNDSASHHLPLSTNGDWVSFCSNTWSIKLLLIQVQQVSRLKTNPISFRDNLMTLEGLFSPGSLFMWSNWCNIPLSGALSCSDLCTAIL